MPIGPVTKEESARIAKIARENASDPDFTMRKLSKRVGRSEPVVQRVLREHNVVVGRMVGAKAQREGKARASAANG